MKRTQEREGRVGASLSWVLAAAFVMVGLGDATAQFRGGPQLAPEKLDAAWSVEAGGVAKELGLDQDATDKLIAAYKEARTSHGKAMEELRSSAGGDRMAMMQGFAEVNDSELQKLQTAITGFLSEDQTQKAIATLGSFNGQWDSMVDTLTGFGLDGDKLHAALGHVSVYIVAVTKATAEARANFDFQSLRGARQELKSTLDTALTPSLTEEQMTKWSEATARRGRGGGGGGRRGPRN